MLSSSEILGVIGDPIVQTGVLALIGALVTRVVLRHHPTRRLVGQLAFFAALTALLLYHDIVPYQPGPPTASNLQRVFVGLAKAVWWVNGAWSLISIVRVFLIFEQQPREGRLLQDLVVGLIYVSALLSVVAYVFDAPVGTLIATSGVFAIILGLALQSTLGDVFSGIALNLSRPYGIGDWLVLGSGIEGRVVETNWRATHLLSGANDLIIVPNSDLAKARLTNMSSPERSHGVSLKVRFLPTTMPAAMAEVMRSVLLSSDAILPTPEPSVQVTGLDANAVELELSFRVAEMSAAGRARSEIYDLVWRHAKAAGLCLSPAADTPAAATPAMPGEAPAHRRATPLRLLDAIALFDALTEEEKEALAATMARRTFRSGETLVAQGTAMTSLMIVRSGVATDTRQDHGSGTELRRLAPGDFFGEGGLLTGEGEPGTIRALTPVVVYEITQEGLAPLLRDRPTIAEELGTLLARRTATERRRLEQGHGQAAANAPSLAERIRHLFDL
ncbi:mechanosensitive ion channel family protein [Inquilinus sp.]|uniref:mechanosensitive ion channel family protein n=1 Tax=Inquilinus sp. TaxID=1932117 RepID=UPI0031D1D89B